MIVNVVWCNLNPDCTISRGFWDQTLLEDLFDRSLWRPAGGISFTHSRYEPHSADANVWPECDGAVVVVPVRHHATDELIARLNERLAQLDWCIFVGTGDEANEFDYTALDHPAIKVWGMGDPAGVDQPIGSGYSPGFPDLVRANPAPAPGRLDVFFCGQDTHSRRHEAIEAARASAPESRRLVVGTDAFLADGTNDRGGLDRVAYAQAMADTKIALAPSGPESPDSFRLYEALEAGAFPVADARTPHGPAPDYWETIFGGPVPFQVMDDWKQLPAVVATVLGYWPVNAAHVQAWWQRWCRDLAYRMDTHIRDLSGAPAEYATPDDQISVVIPTCPIPSHPDTWMIEEVVESIRVQLPHAEIIVVCDGVRPTMADRADEYGEFLARLTRLCQRWHNVVPVMLDKWSHQVGGTRAALELVTTPLLLFCEHDTPLTGEIDWPGLCRIVTDGVVNMVRLHHETAIGPDHKHMALDEPEIHVGQTDAHPQGVPIVRTVQWSQRPHLARTEFYRERVMGLFPAEACTYIEWVLHGEVTHGIENGKEATWERWKVAIYYPPGGNIQRSLHLDGRAGASTADSVEAFKKMREGTGG